MKNSMTTISERARELIHSGQAANFHEACRILQRHSARRRSANAARRHYTGTVRPHWQDN
jgi:hypothetical protein